MIEKQYSSSNRMSWKSSSKLFLWTILIISQLATINTQSSNTTTPLTTVAQPSANNTTVAQPSANNTTTTTPATTQETLSNNITTTTITTNTSPTTTTTTTPTLQIATTTTTTTQPETKTTTAVTAKTSAEPQNTTVVVTNTTSPTGNSTTSTTTTTQPETKTTTAVTAKTSAEPQNTTVVVTNTTSPTGNSTTSTTTTTLSTTTTATTKIPTTTTTTTTTPPVPLYNLTFRTPQNLSSYCNGNGRLFESTENGGATKLCSCFEDFHGLKCENKVDTIMSKLVFGLAILAAIFLIAAIFTGCQWHSRLGDIESNENKVKNLAQEREQLKKVNLELRRSPSPNRRSPSPGRPVSNYAPSNYAPSLMGSPNGGFFEDDRRSVLGDLTMPNFDSQQKMMNQQSRNGDIILEMEDGNNSEDELDAINERKRNGEDYSQKNPDNISIHSASTTNSEMVLLSNTPENKRRRPVSQEITPAMVDGRGYIRNPKPQGARSRSPSPTNIQKSDLSMDNLRKFDNNVGTGGLAVGEPQRGRARSLMDLRVIALTGEAQKYQGGGEVPTNLYKSRSIENILTGQVHRLAPNPYSSSNSSTSSTGRRQQKGIYAQQQQRAMADSSF